LWIKILRSELRLTVEGMAETEVASRPRATEMADILVVQLLSTTLNGSGRGDTITEQQIEKLD
jgi:hypothetical protein